MFLLRRSHTGVARVLLLSGGASGRRVHGRCCPCPYQLWFPSSVSSSSTREGCELRWAHQQEKNMGASKLLHTVLGLLDSQLQLHYMLNSS